MSKITQKTLYDSRVAAGLCVRCSLPLEKNSNRRKCGDCSQLARERRQAIIRLGLCGRCHKNHVVAGFRSCQLCIDAVKVKYNPDYERKYRKGLQEKHVANGLCFKCSKPALSNRKVCQSCMDMAVSTHAKTRLRRIDNNICADCGKVPPLDGIVACADCNGKQKLYYMTNQDRLRAKAKQNYQSRYNAMKVLVYDTYGGKCRCCGITHEIYFTLDHVDNDGYIHRKTMMIRGGEPMLRWIIKNKFPSTIQLLCANCHIAKTRMAPCVH